MIGKKGVSYLLALLMFFIFFSSSCAVERLTITLNDSYPDCYAGEQYDALRLIEKSDNATYSTTAYQIKNEKKVQLDCFDNKFTPQDVGFVYINIKAKIDKKVGYSKEIKLNVKNRAIEESEDNEDDNENIPPVINKDDLAQNPFLFSIATDNYGVESSLYLQTDTSLSGQALRAEIPDRARYTTGYGANFNVWSWICVPLDEIYQTTSVNLTEKYLSFCVKFNNSSEHMSFILEDKNQIFSNEKSIPIGDGANNAFSYCKKLTNGWYQIYIRFSVVGEGTFSQRTYLYGTTFDLSNCKTILFTTSNNGKDTRKPANTYFDKMHLLNQITDDSVLFAKAEIYLPNPSADIETDILFLGNSFIYSSDVGAILQSISDENNKSLRVESYSKGNGTVEELFHIALSQHEDIRKNSWGYKLFTGGYDILVLQAVFGNPNGLDLFYNHLKNLCIDTKIVIMPAYNEGERAEYFYYQNSEMFDLINWRNAINHLRSFCGLSNWDLNQAGDDWHANALSGYCAAIMMYYSLYNNMPDILSATHSKLMAGYHVSGSSILPYNFVMRGTQAEKLERLSIIRDTVLLLA